jgi:hypothetical protein
VYDCPSAVTASACKGATQRHLSVAANVVGVCPLRFEGDDHVAVISPIGVVNLVIDVDVRRAYTILVVLYQIVWERTMLISQLLAVPSIITF